VPLLLLVGLALAAPAVAGLNQAPAQLIEETALLSDDGGIA
jgi:hypothetical protein